MTDIDRLRELNADHHRRMAEDPVKKDPKRLERLAQLDAGSRSSLIEAMLGCENRWSLRQSGPRRVLELGAGYAGERNIISDWLEAEYTGIEVVSEVAEKSGVLCMAIEEIPDDWAESFDFVYSRHVMEHAIDLPLALRNIRKVLKPNGIVGAVTPHFFPDPEPAHLNKLRVEEWVRLYDTHGFKAVYAQVSTFFVKEAHIVAVRDDLPTP